MLLFRLMVGVAAIAQTRGERLPVVSNRNISPKSPEIYGICRTKWFRNLVFCFSFVASQDLVSDSEFRQYVFFCFFFSLLRGSSLQPRRVTKGISIKAAPRFSFSSNSCLRRIRNFTISRSVQGILMEDSKRTRLTACIRAQQGSGDRAAILSPTSDIDGKLLKSKSGNWGDIKMK